MLESIGLVAELACTHHDVIHRMDMHGAVLQPHMKPLVVHLDIVHA
tara:strand:- start:140 stop:277 length:138 start_codon:yes stop_codon:yes gene_type:complete